MKIINLPIEPLPERYSVDWQKWFTLEFDRHSLSYISIFGKEVSREIKHGSFLDVLDTNIYKTSQTERLIEYLKMEYNDGEPTIVFFQDLWHPGLTQLAYIRDGMGWTNLKICGCLHAGTYDEEDFLYKKGMVKWGRKIEEQWFFNIADTIFVATEFHRKLLYSVFNTRSNVFVTGFPIFDNFWYDDTTKENIVVFPHRLDAEKQPELFDKVSASLKSKFPNWQFIKTKEVAIHKQEYYKILSLSKIAVSCAKQETWGIAMQEAVLHGCIPLCPDRLSYQEMYLPGFLYYQQGELERKLTAFMSENIPYHTIQLQQAMIIDNGRKAIPYMIYHMQNRLSNGE